MNSLLELRDFLVYSLRHPKVRLASWAMCLSFVLNLAVLLFFWGPSAWRHHQLVQAIEGERHARLETEQTLEFSRRYQELTKRATTLEERWETPASQASLIESLNRLAAKNGLRVLSQDFNVETGRKGGQAMDEELSLLGAYPSLRHFLTDLENLKTLTVVRETRLEKAGEAGAEVRATLKLCTYNRPGPGKRS